MAFLCCPFVCLEPNEQAVSTSCTGAKAVHQGPGCEMYSCCASIDLRQAVVLQADEFVKVVDHETGIKKTVAGSDGQGGQGNVLWLEALEEVIGAPGQKCPNLTQEQYLMVENKQTGEKRVEVGPQLFRPDPYDEVMSTNSAIKLTKEQFIVVEDCVTGVKRNEIGPQMFIPGPFDEFCSVPQMSYNLAVNEYLRIIDENGVLRVERGEKRVVPGPLETVLEENVYMTVNGKRKKQKMKKQEAVNIDEHTAVIVRDTENGTLKQYCEHGLFVPGPYQYIEEVQDKIVLQEFERMAYKDQTGRLVFVSGASEMRNFFLPPFCEVVIQEWSTDLKKEHKETSKVWRFDVRPSYMQYEFQCRTVDNVELVVDVSFYWSIVDLEKMVMCTADAPGDICTHARSKIIQSVSNKTLMEFLRDFNEIIRDGAGLEAQHGNDEVQLQQLQLQTDQAKSELRAAKQQLDTVNHKSPAEVPVISLQPSIGLDFHSSAEEEASSDDEGMPQLKHNARKREAEQRFKDAKKAYMQLDKKLKQSQASVKVFDPFYGSRGVDLIAVEVLRFNCSNADTDHTLQQIIKETADRLKKKECQEGENEVAMSKMAGDINLEKKNAELIQIKKSHMITESRIEGQAEAEKVNAFISHLSNENSNSHINPEKAVELYTMLRKMDAIQVMSSGNNTMYVTPDDVNLSIGQLYPSQPIANGRVA